MSFTRYLLLLGLSCTAGLTQAADLCELPPCNGIPARTFSGKVIAVMDGDTLLVLQDGKPVKIRLADVDAPEVGHAVMGGKSPNSQKAQPYGDASKLSLSEMVMGKQVQVSSRAIDVYGRMVAMVSIGGMNVNHEQVRRGLAWDYSRFHSNRDVMALQQEARQARIGLWAGDVIIEPAQWRKLHPSPLPVPMPADPSCAKTQCSQMVSCEEAKDYLARCGILQLDGDGDGIPCEALCGPQSVKQ